MCWDGRRTSHIAWPRWKTNPMQSSYGQQLRGNENEEEMVRYAGRNSGLAAPDLFPLSKSLVLPRPSLVVDSSVALPQFAGLTLRSFVDPRFMPLTILTCCDERVNPPHTPLWAHAGCCLCAWVVHIICPYRSPPSPIIKCLGRSDRVLVRSSCPPRVNLCLSESLVV